MSRLTGPGQQPQAGEPRPAMRTGTGIFLITAGAVLLFALPAGSPHWLNLHVVGVILILAGALGLLLPRLARAPLHPGRLRRRARPGQPRDLSEGPAASTAADEPTLARDIH